MVWNMIKRDTTVGIEFTEFRMECGIDVNDGDSVKAVYSEPVKIVQVMNCRTAITSVASEIIWEHKSSTQPLTI